MPVPILKRSTPVRTSLSLARSVAAALLIAVGTLACSTESTPPASDPSGPPAVSVAPDVLMDVDRAFARSVAERGAEAWVESFSESGAMLVPGAEIRGHPAIREAMTPSFETPGFSLNWDPTRARISAGGDLGYTIGRYRSEAPGEDGAVVSEGTYVTIWRLGEDGEWRVELDLGVPDGG